MKKALLAATMVIASAFSLTANANTVATSQILELSDSGAYFTDKVTYLDWLVFDETKRAQS